MSKLFSIIMGAIIMSYAVPSYADIAQFYHDKARGWHWYEEKPKEEENNEAQPIPEAFKTAKEELGELQERLDELKARAVMTGKYEDVKNYIEIQNAVIGKSEQFAKTWKLVLLNNPELSESTKNPNNSIGIEIAKSERDKGRDATIHNLSQEFGLFFFFDSTCPYCHAMAPIVKNFSQRYGWSVINISRDGQPIPGAEKFEKDMGASQKFGIEAYPRLFMVNPTSHQVFKIATGLVAQDEIEDNILLIYEAMQQEKNNADR